MRAPDLGRRFAAAVLVSALAVAGCASTQRPTSQPPPSTTPTPTSPLTTVPAVGFSSNGQPVYGALGPEGVPLETGPPLAPPSATVTGQAVDGVSCNTTEQLAYHHHVHLIVFVNGVAQSLPLGIGIMPQVGLEQTPQGPFAVSSTNCFYWLHVHAADGVIHVESPMATTFTLGQAFGVYGQPLGRNQVGPAQGPMTTTINGVPFSGDPANIPLNERDQIVINVGGPAVVPPPIDWSPTQL